MVPFVAMASLNLYPATVDTPTGSHVGRAYVNDDGRARVYADADGRMVIAAEAKVLDMGGVVGPHGTGEITTADGVWKITYGGVTGCGCGSTTRRWDPDTFGEPDGVVGTLVG